MQKQGRPTRWMMLCGLLALVLVLVACGEENKPAGTPDAKTILLQSQAAMIQVKSYHFTLTTENPGQSSEMITVKSAEGDIEVPDKLKATGNVIISGFAAKTEFVAIDGEQYYKNPLTRKWEQGVDLLDPRVITDSQTGIAGLLGSIQDPSTPKESDVDGTACWSIDGKIDTKYLQAITGMASTTEGKLVDTTVCIGKTDSRPYLIKINGEAFEGDKKETVRTFKLSKFDEPVNIQAPKV